MGFGAAEAELPQGRLIQIQRVLSTKIISEWTFLVVLGNCQLSGGGHEGQLGFTRVLLKAVLLHQWVQSAGWVWSQSTCARCSAPRRLQLRPWRLKRRAMCTSIFFSMTPLPLRTGARWRPNERHSAEGILRQLSIPSRLPRIPTPDQPRAHPHTHPAPQLSGRRSIIAPTRRFQSASLHPGRKQSRSFRL